MPINQANTRNFHLRLYGQILEPLVILKRNDDQRTGTVRSVSIFDCRRHGSLSKTGEPLQHSMSSDNRVTWMIPKTEMDRVGIAYFSAADRVIDQGGGFWEPEADTNITQFLFDNYIWLACKKVDPPAADEQ